MLHNYDHLFFFQASFTHPGFPLPFSELLDCSVNSCSRSCPLWLRVCLTLSYSPHVRMLASGSQGSSKHDSPFRSWRVS